MNTSMTRAQWHHSGLQTSRSCVRSLALFISTFTSLVQAVSQPNLTHYIRLCTKVVQNTLYSFFFILWISIPLFIVNFYALVGSEGYGKQPFRYCFHVRWRDAHILSTANNPSLRQTTKNRRYKRVYIVVTSSTWQGHCSVNVWQTMYMVVSGKIFGHPIAFAPEFWSTSDCRSYNTYMCACFWSVLFRPKR